MRIVIRNEDLADLNSILRTDLSNVEELDCSDSLITFGQLTELLAKMHKLKRIVINRCRNLGNEISVLLNTDLSNVEVLYCIYSSITFAQLAALVAKMPKLKRINIYGCRNLGNEISELNVELSSIEELDCTYSSITFSQLAILVAKMPKLKKISIAQCQNLGDEISALVNKDLSNIEVLDCSSLLTMTFAQLAVLVAKMPKLKKISIAGWQNFGNEISALLNIDLSKVENLDCSYSSITLAQLVALAAKMPKLKKIDISGCRNLGNEISELNVELSSIEELDCSDSLITFAKLAVFMSRMPGLKYIRIYDCQNLGDEVASLPINLNLTELEYTGIPRSVKAELLLAAPNINWTKGTLFGLFSNGAANDKLDEVIALHLFYKHDLTREEQNRIINYITSDSIKSLIGVRTHVERQGRLRAHQAKLDAKKPQARNAGLLFAKKVPDDLQGKITGSSISWDGVALSFEECKAFHNCFRATLASGEAQLPHLEQVLAEVFQNRVRFTPTLR